MLVLIKNRTTHPVLLKSTIGDSIQINGGVSREVSEDFLISYDSTAIQRISKRVLKTEVAPVIEEAPITNSSDIIVADSKEPKKNSKSSPNNK